MLDYVVGVAVLCVLGVLVHDVRSLKTKKKPAAKKKKLISGKEKVYVLANPSFRAGVFKVGLTTRSLSVRMRELFTTGVPTPFVPCMELYTDDCKSLEKNLHEKFSSTRVNERREFFELTKADLDGIIRGSGDGHYIVMRNDVAASDMALTGNWRA